MPNNTTNILVIYAEEEGLLEKIHDAVLTRDTNGELQMDFQKINPMPEELNVSSGSMGDEAYACLHSKDGWKKYMEYKWVQEAGIKTREELTAFLEKRADGHSPLGGEDNLSWRELGDRYASNLEKYGAKTWYSWCVANWGTKWNAYSTSIEEDGCRLVITFQTAWSPPVPIYEKLEEMFPDADIEAYWSDEGSYERSQVY